MRLRRRIVQALGGWRARTAGQGGAPAALFFCLIQCHPFCEPQRRAPGARLRTASRSQGRARFPHVACTSPPRPPAQRTPGAQCRRRLQRCPDAACPWAATARIHACHAHRPARAAARIQHALPERLKAGSQDWRKRHPSPQNLAVRMPRSLGSALTAPTHHDHLGNPHRLSRAFALRGPWGRTPAHPTSHAQGTALELHAKQPGGCDTLDPALMVPPAAPGPRLASWPPTTSMAAIGPALARTRLALAEGRTRLTLAENS